jgi:hypothetical protein
MNSPNESLVVHRSTIEVKGNLILRQIQISQAILQEIPGEKSELETALIWNFEFTCRAYFF